MLTILIRAALRRFAAYRRRAEARALLGESERRLCDLTLGRRALEAALAEPGFESALDVAYRDSARLHATYAVH